MDEDGRREGNFSLFLDFFLTFPESKLKQWTVGILYLVEFLGSQLIVCSGYGFSVFCAFVCLLTTFSCKMVRFTFIPGISLK